MDQYTKGMIKWGKNKKDILLTNHSASKNDNLTFWDLSTDHGELKNPLENKNKHIRIRGPNPKTKRTIFAVLGVVCLSSFTSIKLEVIFFLDFFLGILK